MPSNSIVRVLSPSAVHSSLEAIVEAHRGRGGGAVQLRFETAPTIAKLLAGGVAADVVIAPPKVMDELVNMRKADPEGRFPLGRVGVGVCVRAGAPVPDVSSTAALTRSLREAETIFHTRASSGMYVAALLERLGIAAEVKAKTRSYHDALETFTRLLESKGRDIGFGGITEIRRWGGKGVQFVAPLPPDIQNYTTYLAALSPEPSDREGARAFLSFLGSPAAKAIFLANGVVSVE